jgi:hypothetical protein
MAMGYAAGETNDKRDGGDDEISTVVRKKRLDEKQS